MRLPALLVLVLEGCFYTDPVNGRPVARIDDPMPATRHLGDTLTLSARYSSDPDEDPLSYAWVARSCGSPTACDAPFASGNQHELGFAIRDKRSVRVDLVVTDPHGSQSSDSLWVTPENVAPTVTVQVSHPAQPNPNGSYTVGRRIELRVAAADDDVPTQLALEWALRPPPASDPDAVAWDAPLGGGVAQLRPDVAGTWRVEATATDPEGAGTTDGVTFVIVADQPPCIDATSPAVAEGHYIVERSAGPRRFGVETVSDDLDPYPLVDEDPELGGASFRWWVGTSPQPQLTEVAGHNLPDFSLDPEAYLPGDVVALRVEVRDRVGRDLCPSSEPACELVPGCFQRVTWRVEIR